MNKDLNKLSFKELSKEIDKLKEKQKNVENKPVSGSAFVIGKNYLIRTVTMIYTGKLTKVFDKELVIIDCAWIPETERWADTVKNGTFKEVEPYNDGQEVIINREAILDTTMVDWMLPREQK